MAAKAISFRSMTGVAVLASAFVLSGCGSNGGIDIEFDAPVLNAVGLNLNSKKKQEADLPERQGLVAPPSTATLPPPGDGEQQGSASAQNWPDDPDLKKKAQVDAKVAAREKYCAEGDWSGKGGISEYEKATGREQRCPSALGESLNKSFGGRPDKD